MSYEPILKDIRDKKIEDFEIFLQKPEITEAHIRQGSTVLLNSSRPTGYSIRIAHKGGVGLAFSHSLKKESIARSVDAALRIAQTNEVPDFSFPIPRPTKSVEIVDSRISNEPEAVIKEYTNNMQKNLPKGAEVTFGKVRCYKMATEIVNSQGVNLTKNETYMFMEIAIKAKEANKIGEYWTMRYARRVQDAPPALIDLWSENAASMLRSIEPKTEKMTIIFSPAMVCDGLVPTIGVHVTGLAQKEGFSKFKQNEKIASEILNVLDDGLFPYGIQSSPFDDEGNPQSTTKLIEKGIFKDYLYDEYLGSQYGRKSTGNGIRQQFVTYYVEDKFKLKPRNQPTNLRILPGNKSLETLIEETENGLLLDSFSWLNPSSTSGQFSAEIRNAFHIKNGEIADSVKGGLVSGDFFELVNNISGISNKAEITSGATAIGCVSPYIRFEGVQVAGK
ncbi:MAG: TldD/PmbA family protein [Candidatus Hodarchaeota archaeon]